jgi:hypothetical protein
MSKALTLITMIFSVVVFSTSAEAFETETQHCAGADRELYQSQLPRVLAQLSQYPQSRSDDWTVFEMNRWLDEIFTQCPVADFVLKVDQAKSKELVSKGYQFEIPILYQRMLDESQKGYVLSRTIEKFRIANRFVGLSSEEIEGKLEPLVHAGKQKAKANETRCHFIDLRDQLPEVRDQGGVGWCYAFATADMLSQKLKTNISALDIALAYNHDKSTLAELYWYRKLPSPVDEGGTIATAIRAVTSEGVCTEDEIPSDTARAIQAIKSILRETASASQPTTERFNEPIEEKGDLVFSLSKSVFPNLTRSDFDYAYKHAPSPNRFIEQIRQKGCRKRIQVKGIHINEVTNPRGFLDAINQSLNNNRIAGITYSYSRMFPGSLLFLSKEAKQNSLRELHDSTLVGQRLDQETGRCEYLLRNSYGKDWLKSGCQMLGEKDCNGYLWIPEEILTSALKRVQNFDR